MTPLRWNDIYSNFLKAMQTDNTLFNLVPDKRFYAIACLLCHVFLWKLKIRFVELCCYSFFFLFNISMTYKHSLCFSLKCEWHYLFKGYTMHILIISLVDFEKRRTMFYRSVYLKPNLNNSKVAYCKVWIGKKKSIMLHKRNEILL